MARQRVYQAMRAYHAASAVRGAAATLDIARGALISYLEQLAPSERRDPGALLVTSSYSHTDTMTV